MFAVVGPTGTGKSALAINLACKLAAKNIRAEIINADAMQLYRGMDIGTAKVSLSERRGVPHHLLDVLEPSQEASVNAYQKQALELISALERQNVVPIIVGGSGLYVNSVLYKMNFAPHNSEIRASLEKELTEHGPEHLIARLRQLDPESPELIDTKNHRRVVRALEVLLISGKPLKYQLPQQPELLRKTLVIGISEERPQLTARLDRRVEKMWEAGLLEEVATLVEHGLERGKTASQAIGYAQASNQLKGEATKAEAIAETQLLTRRYARRQMSWFKRLPEIKWFTTAQSQDEQIQEQLLVEQQKLTDRL